MISFIIVTYNSNDYIENCIRSVVANCKNVDFEVIVVDNSSAEVQPVTEMLAKATYDKVKFIANDNQGYGQGNNVGIFNAKGNIIAIVNPDVRFTEPFADVVIEKFRTNSNMALLGLKQIGGADLSFYLKPEYFFPVLTSMITKLFNSFDLFLSKYFYLSGACLFIDKKKFEHIGLFDESIFMYFEEPDISNRLRDATYDIHYEKGVRYEHLVGDRSAFNKKIFLIWKDSLKAYFKKNGFNYRRQVLLRKLDFRIRDRNKFVNF